MKRFFKYIISLTLIISISWAVIDIFDVIPSQKTDVEVNVKSASMVKAVDPFDLIKLKQKSNDEKTYIGEAIIRLNDSEMEDRYRVASIVNALSQYSLEIYAQSASEEEMSNGAITFSNEHYELYFKAELSNGVLLKETVTLSIPDANVSWSLENYRLVKPEVGRELHLEALIEIVDATGLSVVESYRKNNEIWQSTLVMRE